MIFYALHLQKFKSTTGRRKYNREFRGSVRPTLPLPPAHPSWQGRFPFLLLIFGFLLFSVFLILTLILTFNWWYSRGSIPLTEGQHEKSRIEQDRRLHCTCV